MFIHFMADLSYGAPAQRYLLVDEYIESFVSLRGAKETLRSRFYKRPVPPALKDLSLTSLILLLRRDARCQRQTSVKGQFSRYYPALCVYDVPPAAKRPSPDVPFNYDTIAPTVVPYSSAKRDFSSAQFWQTF